MMVNRAFRFRVYPSARQRGRMAVWESALRFLWNLAHEQRLLGLAKPRGERKFYSAFDQHKELTDLRAELPWLADVPRGTCERVLVDLDKAWQRCFLGLGRQPIWKRKGSARLSLHQHDRKMWRLDGLGLHFPKLGPMRIVRHRQFNGAPKSCALVRDADQWFAAIVCQVEAPAHAPRTEPVVALDRGVVNVVADSDGRIIPAPRHLKSSLAHLARAQRIVSRRQKGSANREKAKLKVAKLHRKVRRQRDHFLHVLSAAYAKSHGTVVVEKLNVKGMVRSGNRGLSRGILDAGWGRFAGFLRYKLEQTGGRLVEVPAAYSSQTCSECGTVDPLSRRSQSEFACSACGTVVHADLNAAKVLKSRANRSALPVEGLPPEGSRGSRKRLRTPWRSSAEAVAQKSDGDYQPVKGTSPPARTPETP